MLFVAARVGLAASGSDICSESPFVSALIVLMILEIQCSKIERSVSLCNLVTNFVICRLMGNVIKKSG